MEETMAEKISCDDEQEPQSQYTTFLPLPSRPGRMLAAAEITVRNINSRDKVQKQLHLILEPKFYEINNSNTNEETMKIEDIHEFNNEVIGESVTNCYNKDTLKTNIHESEAEIDVKYEIKIEEADINEEHVAPINEAADNCFVAGSKEEDMNSEDVPDENLSNNKILLQKHCIKDRPSEKCKVLKRSRKRRSNSPTELRNLASDGSTSQASNTHASDNRNYSISHLHDTSSDHISLNNTDLNCNIKTYNCPFCSYKAIQSVDLSQHLTEHDKRVYYHCSYCSYKTNYKSHLNVHINGKHSKTISFNCSYCEYITYNKAHLSIHINTKHTKSTCFDCSHCNYKTYNRSALYKHNKTKHLKN